MNDAARDPALSNADLDPTPASQRTWGVRDMASLWIGMVVCVPTYMLAGGLVDLGMSAGQAVFTVALGNLVVLVPMLLNGHPGARYGIPFPVLARASFGVLGANIPALLRGLVACGWFGIQTWIGGAAIHSLVGALLGTPLGGADLPGLGITASELVCFGVFWSVQAVILWRGIGSIQWVERWAAPFLVLMGLVLLGWAWQRADGLGPMLSAPSAFGPGGAQEGRFWATFFPALTGMVGFWATLSLNIPDFTRYATSQRSQVLGQAIGLPTFMTLFSFIGVAVTSATVKIFGEPIADPIALLGHLEGGVAVILSLVALTVATLSTNLAANVVSPANALVNLAPSHISFRTGAMLTAGLGVVMMPWKILESTSGFIFTWLIGYSALLGPIGGILIVDYWILRRARLETEDLYRRGGEYEFRHGANPAAMIALVVGILPNVPGFLETVNLVESVPAVFSAIYPYAWFVGFAISGAVHALLSRRIAR